MNNVNLIGRLTNDPDTRQARESGNKIANYSLAVDRRGDGTDFIRCVAFGKQAEFAEKYLRKGMKMGVTGSLHTDSYTDKEGRKVNTTEVIVNEHYFCESKKASPEGFEDAPMGVPFR